MNEDSLLGSFSMPTIATAALSIALTLISSAELEDEEEIVIEIMVVIAEVVFEGVVERS